MKRFFLSIIVLIFSCSMWAQDTQILGSRDWIGTARYVGLTGAMTAIGADASAVWDNPAGLGMYRNYEVQATLDLQTDRVRWSDIPKGEPVQWSNKKNYFMPSSASVVFQGIGMGEFEHQFMVGFRRMKNFSRYSNTAVPTMMGDNNYSSIESNESGYINDYSFTYAFDYADMFSFGVGIGLQNYQYIKDVSLFMDYGELNSKIYDKYHTTDILSGLAVQGRIGLLFHPNEWISMGASFATPAVGRMNVSDDNYIESTKIDTLNKDYGVVRRTRSFAMPLRFSAGVAGHLYHYVTLSLQYDLAHHSRMNKVHTFHAALEIRPIENLYIDLGYAYETPNRYYRSGDVASLVEVTELNDRYKDSQRSDSDYRYTNYSHIIGAGLGYRARSFGIHFGYQYRHQNYDIYTIQEKDVHTSAYDFDAAHYLAAETHRFVLTLQFISPSRTHSGRVIDRNGLTKHSHSESQSQGPTAPYFTTSSDNTSVTLHR